MPSVGRKKSSFEAPAIVRFRLGSEEEAGGDVVSACRVASSPGASKLGVHPDGPVVALGCGARAEQAHPLETRLPKPKGASQAAGKQRAPKEMAWGGGAPSAPCAPPCAPVRLRASSRNSPSSQ